MVEGGGKTFSTKIDTKISYVVENPIILKDELTSRKQCDEEDNNISTNMMPSSSGSDTGIAASETESKASQSVTKKKPAGTAGSSSFFDRFDSFLVICFYFSSLFIKHAVLSIVFL